MKIQSVRASLEQIPGSKIPQQEAIEECLERLDKSFREALGYRSSKKLR